MTSNLEALVASHHGANKLEQLSVANTLTGDHTDAHFQSLVSNDLVGAAEHLLLGTHKRSHDDAFSVISQPASDSLPPGVSIDNKTFTIPRDGEDVMKQSDNSTASSAQSIIDRRKAVFDTMRAYETKLAAQTSPPPPTDQLVGDLSDEQRAAIDSALHDFEKRLQASACKPGDGLSLAGNVNLSPEQQKAIDDAMRKFEEDVYAAGQSSDSTSDSEIDELFGARRKRKTKKNRKNKNKRRKNKKRKNKDKKNKKKKSKSASSNAAPSERSSLFVLPSLNRSSSSSSSSSYEDDSDTWSEESDSSEQSMRAHMSSDDSSSSSDDEDEVDPLGNKITRAFKRAKKAVRKLRGSKSSNKAQSDTSTPRPLQPLGRASTRASLTPSIGELADRLLATQGDIQSLLDTDLVQGRVRTTPFEAIVGSGITAKVLNQRTRTVTVTEARARTSGGLSGLGASELDIYTALDGQLRRKHFFKKIKVRGTIGRPALVPQTVILKLRDRVGNKWKLPLRVADAGTVPLDDASLKRGTVSSVTSTTWVYSPDNAKFHAGEPALFLIFDASGYDASLTSIVAVYSDRARFATLSAGLPTPAEARLAAYVAGAMSEPRRMQILDAVAERVRLGHRPVVPTGRLGALASTVALGAMRIAAKKHVTSGPAVPEATDMTPAELDRVESMLGDYVHAVDALAVVGQHRDAGRSGHDARTLGHMVAATRGAALGASIVAGMQHSNQVVSTQPAQKLAAALHALAYGPMDDLTNTPARLTEFATLPAPSEARLAAHIVDKFLF